MRLHALLLTKDEKVILSKIYVSLCADPGNKTQIRAEFTNYIENTGNQKIDSASLSRLLKNPLTASQNLQLLLYDYSREILFPSILRDVFAGRCSHDTRLEISAFIEMRDKRNIPSFMMPQQVTQLNYAWEFMQTVPSCFINEFIGYRRSTSSNSIMQYYISFERTDDPKVVSFENVYIHNRLETIVKGFGIYINRSLYLIGHAMTSDKSAGMRMLALRQHRDTNYICGIVVSASRDVPVAAREVLIPANYHNNWPAHIDHKGISDRVRNEIVISKFGDQKNIGDILANIIPSQTIHSNEVFSLMIENITTTTLCVGMELAFHEELGKQMYRLRQYVKRSGSGSDTETTNGAVSVLGDELASAIKKYIEENTPDSYV